MTIPEIDPKTVLQSHQEAHNVLTAHAHFVL